MISTKVPQRPEAPFSDTSTEWLRFAEYLASEYALTNRHIAGAMGILQRTLTNSPNVCGVVNRGRASFEAKVMRELAGLAFDTPENYEEPIERAQVRTMKLDALKTIFKATEKRAELEQVKSEAEATREILSSFTDDELRQKAKELIQRVS